MLVAPAAAAPIDDIDTVTYGADSFPSFILELEDDSMTDLEDWADSSSDREIEYQHNDSNTATVSAPAWHIWSGRTGLWARITAGSVAALTFRDPLEAKTYVEHVELNRRLSYAEPVSTLTEQDDYTTPQIGRLAFNDPDYSTNGLAFDGDVNDTPIEDSRSFVGVDDTVTQTGEGITVAVIDTGANTADGLLFGDGTQGSDTRILNESKNLITGENVSADGIDAVEDGNDHGTWVASAIAANATGTAHDGIAPDADLLIIKALDDSGEGSTTDITDAIRYAAENDADIISMSLGSPIYSQEIQRAITYALEDHDVSAVVVAAGNSRQTTRWIASPADVETTIAVAAVSPAAPASAESAYFSQIGPDPGTTDLSEGESQDATISVAAPGMRTTARIASTGGTLQNETLSGTSMAQPFVAGGIALSLEAHPGWQGDPDTVIEWVEGGARPIPNAATTEVGHGLFTINNTIDRTEPDQDQEDAQDTDADQREAFHEAQSVSQGGLLPL